MVINQTTINITKNFVTNNIVQTAVNSQNQQYLSMEFGYAERCPVKANQTIKSNIQIVNLSDQRVTETLETSLEQTLDNTISQSAEVISGFASMTGGNATDTTNYVRNTINKTINQATTINNINQVAASSYNSNTGKLKYVFCKDTPIEWNQEIVSEIIARNILQSIQDSLMEDSTISSLMNYADQTASTQNKGLDDVIKAATGPSIASAIAAAIICIIFLIGIVVLGMSPAGQESIGKVSNAAVAKI
jgi:hypothetical protein